MNCSKCGTYIADGWRYCKGCGSEAGPPVSPHHAETIRLGAGRPSPSNDPTLILNDPPWNAPTPPTAETVLSPQPPPAAAPVANPNAWTPSPVAPAYPPPTARKKSALIPILAVLGILALGTGTVLALFLTGVIGNQNSGNAGGSQPNRAPEGRVGGPGNNPGTPTPDNTNSDTPTPTPTPVDPTADARTEIMAIMNAWADSLRRRSIADNVSLYASKLDVFYGSQNVSSSVVQSNRQQIFSRYFDSTDVKLSEVNVVVAADGNKAEVTYDNTYNWRGGSKTLSGKSHNKMVLSKINGRWLITSEIHLSQYYENRGG